MSYISLELVPRNESSLRDELELVRNSFPKINAINIPDLLRFPLRSWEGCLIAQKYFNTTIPHLRAMDFDISETMDGLDFLKDSQFSHVLIVQGDKPQETSRNVYGTKSINLISTIRQYYPNLKIYAALDPYRQGMSEEIRYAHQKIDAGINGFFSQPFFDLRLLEMYEEQLRGIDIFWGVSPVLNEKSKRYWEVKNKVVFPSDFSYSLSWNQSFGRELLEFSLERGNSVYFMPIKADTKEYLEGIFDSCSF